MIPCIWKKYLGVECMGCGLQRSMHFLSEGKWWESIQLFPAGIPMVLTLIFLIYHLIFKPRKGAQILTVLFIVTASIMVFSFILKRVLEF